MKFQADLTWKKPLIVLAIMLLAIGQFVVAQNLGTAPQTNVAVQGETAAQPEGAFLNFINWIGNVIAPVGAGRRGRGRRRVLADRSRLWAVVVRGRVSASRFRRHQAHRVLDHQRNSGGDLTARPRTTGRNCAGSP